MNFYHEKAVRLIKKTLESAEPDFVSWWDKQPSASNDGKTVSLNLWQDLLDSLEKAINTENNAVIDSVFAHAEAEAKCLVAFQRKARNWANENKDISHRLMQ